MAYAPDFRRFLVEYRFDGADWVVEIFARDQAEAEARLKALPWARLLGEAKVTIPVPGGAILARLGQMVARLRLGKERGRC